MDTAFIEEILKAERNLDMPVVEEKFRVIESEMSRTVVIDKELTQRLESNQFVHRREIMIGAPKSGQAGIWNVSSKRFPVEMDYFTGTLLMTVF